MQNKPIKIIKGSHWRSKDAGGGIAFKEIIVVNEVIPMVIIQDVFTKSKRRMERADFLEFYVPEMR